MTQFQSDTPRGMAHCPIQPVRNGLVLPFLLAAGLSMVSAPGGVPSMRTARRPSAAVLCTALLALGLGGCVSALQERADDYNEDGLQLFREGDYVYARESFKA